MNPPLNRAIVPVIQKLMSPLAMMEKSISELTVERQTIPVGNGDTIQALLYSPNGIDRNAPCLVYYHGGGFVLPAAPYHYSLAK